MKKLFLSALALLAAVSLYATDLNIYASGLKATQSGGVTTIEYVLNAQATSLNVLLYNGTSCIATIPIPAGANNANFAKGDHTGAKAVTIDLSEVDDGDYTWALEATGTTNSLTQPAELTDYSLTNPGAYSYEFPQDVIVDNNFESPYFGRIYVSEARDGKPSAMTSAGIQGTPTFGLYVYNSDLTFANGETLPMVGYKGGLTGVDLTAFRRLTMDEAGNLYVCSSYSETKGVYRINPSDLTANFTAVLSNKAVFAIEVVGNSLYTLEDIGLNTGTFNKYDISTGTAGSPIFSHSSSATNYINFVNGYCAIRDDKRGGVWMSENRNNANDVYGNVVHIAASSDGQPRDLYIGYNQLKSYGLSGTPRGVIAINPTGDLVAIGDNKKVVVYHVEYDDSGAPSLDSIYAATRSSGLNTDGIAFDLAGNMYVMSASSERFYAYALPKAQNSFETPARSANTIHIGSAINVTGVTVESSAQIERGQTLTLNAVVAPNDATDKTISWESDNTTVATVSQSGVVTAKSEGTANITVTTTDGGKQATCTVTVYRNPVTGITIEPNTLTLAPGFRATLAATVLPENATDKSFTWSSDDETIATIANGLVTAVAVGTTTIKATSVSDGEVYGSCTVTVSPAVAHISAWGLSSAKTETGYTFSFTTNMAATNAAIVFYDKASGNQVGDPVSVTVAEGANEVAIQAAEIPGNVGQELTWAVRLTGADNAAFSKVFESANITGRGHLVVDASPESNYMGRTYYICRTAASSTTLYVFDQNYVQLASKPTYSHGFMHQSIDENGKLWIPDWRDASSGIYIVDPADLNTCTQFFQGTRTASGTYGGIIKNGTVEVGGSSPSCFIYGKGEDRKLFSIQEDFSSVRNQPMAIYNVGTEYTRNTAPEAIYPVTGNNGFTNSIFAVANGYWVSKNCPKASHAKTVPALEFYSMSGKLKYSSYDHRDIIDGCLGTGFTIDPVHNKLYMIDGGSANILEFDVAYDGDSVPTLTPAGKHYIGYKGITSMSMDIAGNLYVTATMSTTIDNTISMKMVVYSPATNGDNTTLVPAKAADVVKPFATLYEFGSNQAWATNAGVAMTEVEDNVFEKVLTFEEEDNYFTFSRAQGATANDWTPVDAHRYGTNASGDYWVTNENINNAITLEAEGTRTNSFKIPAGTYLFRVNLNTMKFNIYTPQNLQVFEFGDNQGWSLTSKIAMKEVEGTFNVFKDTIAFTNSLSYFAFTTSSETTWSDDFKNARYGGNDNAELVDGAAAIALVKGNKDNELCYTIKRGTYEITVNFNTNKVSAKLIGDAVAVSNVGYATYYNSAKAYTMPENMEGYVFNAENGLELEYEAGEIVPMNVGLVLKAAEGSYPLVFAEGGDAPMATNQLLGTDEETALEDDGVSNYYALSLAAAPNDTPESVGFYWMIKDENADRGAAFVNGAHKAYLKLGASQAPQRFYLFHGENNTTDILNVKSADETEKFIENGKLFIRRDGVIYDATGRRVR